MSEDLKGAIPTERATDPCATSASTRQPACQSEMSPTSQTMSPTPSPMRVKSLAPLLMRDNVKAILGLAEIRSLRIQVEFSDGSTDSKSISLAPGGSAALLLIDDNPDRIPPGAFFDIRP